MSLLTQGHYSKQFYPHITKIKEMVQILLCLDMM